MHKTCRFYGFFCLIVLSSLTKCLGDSSSKIKILESPKILVLGGNGLLGSATVRSLLNEAIYDITLLNRGNWYWDTKKIIKPYIKHIKCKRGNYFRDDCTQLHNATFDTIIDFSANDPLDMEDILILLDGRFKRYIYISSDSVYEVCKPKKHVGFSKEEDAVRPENKNSRLVYSKKDDYGHKKLEGEEALAKYHLNLNYEYVNLRLPDVLGPRDNTIRFYKYFIWAKTHKILAPVHIPPHIQDKPISFVYSLDVGRLIASLANPDYDSAVFNASYNLSFRETITLKALITFIGDWLQQGPIEFDESDAANIQHGFPSVSLGPVDISKAKTVLKWAPTKIFKALTEICEFYEAMQYDNDYNHILERVLERLMIRGNKYKEFMELHNKKIMKDEL